jgi:peptidoglycan/xylan/chitin deacetylase (PgdA/CDA1 family)
LRCLEACFLQELAADRAEETRGRCRGASLTLSYDFAPQFALPRAEQSRPARAIGKVSRFLARKIVSKKLSLHNARPLVSFSFDDAPQSACTIGAALLEEHRTRGTYYISGGGCGAAGYCGRLTDAATLKALAAKGHEIGCHTYSHVAVARVGRRKLTAELARNNAFLQDIQKGREPYNFAYPYGEYSLGTKLYLQQRFDSCRSLRPGINVGSADLGSLKSWELQDASIDRRGVSAIIAETVRLNGWLIFACHDVAAEPSRFGVTPDLFAFALKTARDAGCHVASVRDALLILRGRVVYPAGEEIG